MDIGVSKKFTEAWPVEEVLNLLDFSKNQLGNFEQKWDGLELAACPWLTGWVISGNYTTKRISGCPEFRVANEVIPLELFAAFYLIWNEAFPGKALPVEELSIGKHYLGIKKNVQRLLPPNPAVWADREFFRYCISFIEKHHDWSSSDYEVAFSFQDEQLKLTVNNLSIFCPARGSWIGKAIVSGRKLFHSLPKRFLGDAVMIGVGPDELRVESHTIPAHWLEEVN